MRFLFVHGTGVRREGHDRLWERVRCRLLERFPEASVASCFWGEAFGVPRGAGGRAVPGERRTRAAGDGAVVPPDQEAAEWALLLADPLCELRVLADTGGTDDGFGPPGVRAAGSEVMELLAELPTDPGEGDELGGLLRGTGLARHYPPALETVRASDEATRAAANAFEEPAAREFAVAAARALVAEALARAGADAECTGAERDRMVEVITARLGGDARWPGGRAAALLGKLALRVTTQPALNLWRGPITQQATPFLGDILRYQARGQALRDHLHRTITADDGPTVLVGHSLGGVALVDLLAQRAARGEPLRGPRLLVTVGSQAPFLHELGALAGLEPGDPLPDGFPRWLNIFDRQDMLAFLAEPVFPGDPRVTDHEVSSRQPFPPCHSAYWKIGGVYDGIARAVAEAG
ncbi:hypothetical protein [Streptomyces sp. S.PNR 29]|uniref:hypothetical protein n=1 Tax=Streptomyces sp. S.PNR 29 TaxID=2973805 RepID=UPI0025B03672|nr:hypothetical protein [Streptomyces sp. S.PNR 29]MDN0197342.1 hypothetical protein [Streptomyces sp. S.PNR 29]